MLSGSGATDPLRPWRCGGVSCTRAPGSLTDVSSRDLLAGCLVATPMTLGIFLVLGAAAVLAALAPWVTY